MPISGKVGVLNKSQKPLRSSETKVDYNVFTKTVIGVSGSLFYKSEWLGLLSGLKVLVDDTMNNLNVSKIKC